jgi:hypothetical protein
VTLRRDPAALRWLIGVELANFRKQAAIRPLDVCTATEISKPKLSHMENGRYQQNPADIGRILRFYGIADPDIDRLTGLADDREATSAPAWWQPWASVLPNWFTTFLGLEGMADGEFSFEPLAIPGPLQTREYATAFVTATGLVRPDHVERFVSCRVARAVRLTDEPPLRLHAIIGEAALRLRVGAPDENGADGVLARQYQHLLDLADRPNVTIQVLRPEDGPHPASTGQFVVFDFAAAQSVGYVEHLDGATYLHDHDELRTYELARTTLRERALSPNRSAELIEDLLGRA